MGNKDNDGLGDAVRAAVGSVVGLVLAICAAFAVYTGHVATVGIRYHPGQVRHFYAARDPSSFWLIVGLYFAGSVYSFYLAFKNDNSEKQGAKDRIPELRRIINDLRTHYWDLPRPEMWELWPPVNLLVRRPTNATAAPNLVMKLSYTVDVLDVVLFVDHELRTTYRARVWAQSACSAPILGAYVYAMTYSGSQNHFGASLCAILVGLVFLLALPSVTRDQTRKAIRRRYSKAPNIGPQTMSLGPEGLDIESSNGSAHLAWSAVQRVTLTQGEQYAFIFTGPFEAFILPLHQITDSACTEVIAAFAAYVPKAKWNQA